MTWLDTLHHPEYYVKTFLKWAFLSVIVGMIGGLPCAGHDKNRNRLVSVLLFVQLDLNKEMQHAGGTLRTLVQKLVFYSTVINLASSAKTHDSEQESGVFHSL